MKKIILILSVMLILSSCWEEINNNIVNTENNTVIEQNITKKTNLVNIWIDDFKIELAKKDSVLIDLRTLPELQQSWVIEWAINIDYYGSDFRKKLNSLDKDKKYLIYCRSWNRSWRTLILMEKLWFNNVYNFTGSMSSWLRNWEKTVVFWENTNTEEKNISITEVEKHNKKWDCYTAIDWKVYDVSSFFGIHPGWDDNLLKTCGKDATILFQWVHWFNAKAQIKKEEFYIWDLK